MGEKTQAPLGGVAILAVLLLLPGCLPLPISLAINGIFYASSGKTMNDHVLSSLVQRDCSVSRALFTQGSICFDDEDLAIVSADDGEDQEIEIEPASGD